MDFNLGKILQQFVVDLKGLTMEQVVATGEVVVLGLAQAAM